jgi:hypothetical protein
MGKSGYGRSKMIGRKLVDIETGEIIGRWARTLIAGSLGYFKGFPVVNPLSVTYHRHEDYWCPHSGDLWTCGHCNYGLERQDGKMVKVATREQIQADIEWHYVGDIVAMGRDIEGRDYEKDMKNGKVERVYSETEKTEALVVADEYGLSAASRKTGIPRTTLNNWNARRR